MCFHSCYLCEAIINQIMSALHATQLTPPAFRMEPNKIEKRESFDRVSPHFIKCRGSFSIPFIGNVLFHFPLHFAINQIKKR